MSDLLIGEVAREMGIATSTIRYYESIGLLPAPERVSGWRRYDRSVLTKLKAIRAAKNTGWSLDEVKEMTVESTDHLSLCEQWKLNAPEKMQELDLIIEQAQKMKAKLEASLACECQDLEACEFVYLE